jgi:hypothetical protein
VDLAKDPGAVLVSSYEISNPAASRMDREATECYGMLPSRYERRGQVGGMDGIVSERYLEPVQMGI